MASKNQKKAKSIQERMAHRRHIEAVKKAQALDIAADEELLEGDIQEGEEIPEEELSPAALALKEQLEALEKDGGYYAEPMSVPAGPISFDELDAAHAAQEQAHEVTRASWDAQDLVRNILNHPMMEPKAKATAIKNVGDGFEKRISTILSTPETVKKDLDVLSLESILAHDKRNTNFVEQMVDKAKLAMSGENTTPYSIADKAHTRAALAWAAKEIAEGGDGAVLAKEVMPEIRAAAKKFGIEMTMKKDRNAIVIEKDASGSWRWIGWVSNNYKDRSGDIITEAAHKEYVDWVNKDIKNRAPVFTSCHAPGTVREYPVDFVGYENNFLVMSGKLNETEAGSLFSVSKETDIGMSHTGWGSRSTKNVSEIQKYRCFEITDLPVSTADNPFTMLETLSKEADMNQLEYLTSLLGSKEKAEQALVLKTSMAKKELDEAGVESKETAPENQAQALQPVVPDHVMKEIMEKLDIPGLNEFVVKANEAIEKVSLLETVIKELSGAKDDELADMISPPTQTLAWSQKQRASESDKNLLKEGDELMKSKPETGWLSEATGSKPIPEAVQ